MNGWERGIGKVNGSSNSGFADMGIYQIRELNSPARSRSYRVLFPCRMFEPERITYSEAPYLLDPGCQL